MGRVSRDVERRESRADRRDSRDQRRDSRDERRDFRAEERVYRDSDRRDSRVERLESRDIQRKESRDSVSRDFERREARVESVDLDLNPKWNLFSTIDIYPSSKEMLSQFLLGGIALAMLVKKDATKAV